MEILNNIKTNKWFFGINLLFIAINCYLLTKGFIFFALTSLAVAIIFAALFALDKLVYFIVLTTPLSLTMEFSNFAALSIPGEPLLFGVLIIFTLGLLYKGGIDRQLIRHRLTQIIILYLLWSGLTIFSSSMPLVSAKYVLARIWFVVCFYFVASRIFVNYNKIKHWIWLFTIPLCIVIIYSIIQFFNYKIDKNALYWVMQPFFKDHTIYGAVIAMMLPIMFVFSFDRSYGKSFRTISIFVFFLITIGVVLSYTRAAWLSLFISWIIYILFRLRINWRTISFIGIVFLSVLFAYKSEIKLAISQNKQNSSKNLQEHLASVSNIKSDVSNLERINRWSSAMRMFKDRPVFGFGPGTYTFQYAPYQRSSEITYVSTNAGKLGNAHSEYLSALSETGLPGFLLLIGIIFYTIKTASRIYYHHPDKQVANLSMGILIGLLTYFFHGFLNNFLDQDKAALPFWSMISIIVVIDIYHKDLRKEKYHTEK